MPISEKDRLMREIMDSCTPLMYHVANNLLSACAVTREDVEDCVAETLADIWQGLDGYDSGRSALKTWALMICRRRAIDFSRSCPKRAHVSTDDEAFGDVADGKLGFEEELALREDVRAVMDSLNEREKAIFYRRYFLGESMRDIGRDMRLAENNVANICHRARNRIKQAFAERELKYE